MTCDEIRERLIDFLYREMPAEEHATFEAHLAGCDSCRREVESLGGTLTTARTAVRSTLDDPPPSRVRAAVMEAARAAVSGPALAAAARRPPAASAVGDRSGFWDFLRVLRRSWVLPAFAAASAIGLFVLTRQVILRPEPAVVQEAPVVPAEAAKSAEEAPRPRLEREARLSAPADEVKVAAPRPSAPPPATASAPSEAYRPAPSPKPAMRRRPVASRDDARPTPPSLRPQKVVTDDPLGGLVLGNSGRASGSAGAVAQEKDAKKADKGKAEAVTAVEAQRVARDLDQLRKAGPRPYATPPPAREPAPAAAPPAAAPEAAPPQPAPEPASRSSFADETASAAEEERPKAKRTASPLEELMSRGAKAFAAGRWAEAASAYRDLVRRYPEHKLVPSWKGRVRACEAALAQ